MRNPTTKERRMIRDAAFKLREQPRMVWPSQQAGTAVRMTDDRGGVFYVQKPKVQKRKQVLTEAQDNAIGRAIRRRRNRAARGWLPHAKR